MHCLDSRVLVETKSGLCVGRKKSDVKSRLRLIAKNIEKCSQIA